MVSPTESTTNRVHEFEDIIRKRGFEATDLTYFLMDTIIGDNDNDPEKSANKLFKCKSF